MVWKEGLEPSQCPVSKTGDLTISLFPVILGVLQALLLSYRCIITADGTRTHTNPYIYMAPHLGVEPRYYTLTECLSTN